MSENKQPNAKELAEQIAILESVEEIEALIEGDERITVKHAAEKRIAELTEAVTMPLEEASKEEVPDENAKAAEPDPVEAGAAEKVAIVGVPAEGFKAVADLVADHIEGELEFLKGSKQSTESVDALAEAAKVFDCEVKGAIAQVEEPALEALEKAVIKQTQLIKARIGMTQPSNHVTALFAVHAIITEKK